MSKTRETSEIVIAADRDDRHYWLDLWRFRELFYFLAWRDVLVRYKQTLIGIAWSLLRPILTMVIFTLVFSKLAKLPSGGAPYPLLVFSAMLPWHFFGSAILDAGGSLIGGSNLLSKVYFPRLIVPASAMVAALLDFAISLVVLVALMLWYRHYPGIAVLALPLFLLLVVTVAFGVGIWIASLSVKYRDFQFVAPFVLQAGLYLSPVGFSSAIVPADWRLLYSLNPLVGVIDGFRWALLGGTHQVYLPGLVASILTTSLILVSGIWYFRRTERFFADVV